MKEKLIIKNFGPIKSAELDLGKMNIFIGDQATGKTTIGKLIAICRDFRSFTETKSFYPFGDNPITESLKVNGLYQNVNKNSEIKYENEDYLLEVKLEEKEEIVEYDEENDKPIIISLEIMNPTITAKSKRFKNLLEELEKTKPVKNKKSIFSIQRWVIPSSFFSNDVASVIDKPVYVPVERSVQAALFFQGANNGSLLHNWFYKYNNIKEESFYNEEIEIEPVNISYKNSGGKESSLILLYL